MTEQNKDIKYYMKDIYEYTTKNLSRKTLLEAVSNIFNNKPLVTNLDWKWPIYRYFYIKEDFDNTPSEEEIYEADSIYHSLRNYILKNVSKEERDIIALYTVYGDLASFKYDIDEQRLSDFNGSLYNCKADIKTKYGNLIFKFCGHDDYNVDSSVLAGYDNEEKAVIIFIENANNIKTIDLINVLRRRNRFIHELSHYIDDINKNLSYEEYDFKTPEGSIKYLNDPSEFKANVHSLIYSFGGYLFKNQNEIMKKYDLQNNKDIDILLNVFLNDTSKNNVLDDEDLSIFRKCLAYWYPENKKKFYDFLHKTISNTQKKINYTESERKNNILKLLKLEETLLEIGD